MVDATSQALARMIYSSGEVWEEKEQKPVFDVERLFDPYRMVRRGKKTVVRREKNGGQKGKKTVVRRE